MSAESIRPTFLYGAVSNFEVDGPGLDLETSYSPPAPRLNSSARRWSILNKFEKFDRRYSTIRTCGDVYKIVNFKCFLATMMLVLFFVFGAMFTRALFSGVDLTPAYYDFIIVGGGPSGGVVARALVMRGARVLLLEAGISRESDEFTPNLGQDVSTYDIPLLWPAASSVEDSIWPEVDSVSSEAPIALQGKGVGGTESISAMVYSRALPSDVQKWNTAGWTWEKLLSMYKIMESGIDPRMMTDNNQVVSQYYGRKLKTGPLESLEFGPSASSRPSFYDSLSLQFVQSSQFMNIGYNADFNSHDHPRIGRLNTVFLFSSDLIILTSVLGGVHLLYLCRYIFFRSRHA
jgi:hypothetical protein